MIKQGFTKNPRAINVTSSPISLTLNLLEFIRIIVVVTEGQRAETHVITFPYFAYVTSLRLSARNHVNGTFK